MIFQDPYASLNPRKRVGQIVGDPLQAPRDRLGRRARPPRPGAAGARRPVAPSTINRFPHEFSGGQRQRIGIARALSLRAEADHRRRAGLGARRLDPGADHQPARGPAGRVRPHLRLRRARPRRRAPRLRPDRGHVPRQDRRDRARRRGLRRTRSTRTPWRCSRRCRSPTRARTPRASRWCSRATCRARSNPPAACRFHTRCPRATDICSRGRAAARRLRQRPLGGLPPPGRARAARGAPAPLRPERGRAQTRPVRAPAIRGHRSSTSPIRMKAMPSA